jgi:hypothetical protein
VLENVFQAGLPANINGHRVFLSTVLSAANTVKECAFSTEHGKTVFTAMMCSLGSALSVLLAAKATTRSSVMWRSVCLPVAERLVETAVGLSQIEPMCSFFVMELEAPSDTAINNTTTTTTTTTSSNNNKTQTTAGVIIAVLRSS